MSSMSEKFFDVQEDIIDLLNQGKTETEIDEIIVEMHGEMYRGMVTDLLNEEENNE